MLELKLPQIVDASACESDYLAAHVHYLPVLGQVAAGAPLESLQVLEDTFAIDKRLTGSKAAYILQIKGDSMIDAGICNGDMVIVSDGQVASNGDIVVAVVGDDDEATVKRYFEKSGYVCLQPENEHYEPIITANVRICGVVIGLFRRY